MTAPLIFGPSGQGLNPLIQALQARQQRDIQQQQIDVQRQQAQSQQANQRLQAFDKIMSAVEAGGIEILDDENFQQAITSAGFDPKTLKPRIQRTLQEREQQRVATQQTFIEGYPDELREAAKIAVNAFNAIGTSEAFVQAFDEVAERTVDADKEATLREQFPELRDLPRNDLFREVAKLQGLKLQLREGVSPQAMLEARLQLAELQASFGALRNELLRMELEQKRAGGTPQEQLNFAQDVKAQIDQTINDISAVAASGIDPEVFFGASRASRIRMLMGIRWAELDKRADEIAAKAIERQP